MLEKIFKDKEIEAIINNVNNVLLSDNSVLRSILLQKIELGEAVLRRSGKIDPLVATGWTYIFLSVK